MDNSKVDNSDKFSSNGLFPISKMSYFSNSDSKEIEELERMRTIVHFKDNQRFPMSMGGHVGFYYIHSGYSKLVCNTNDQQQIIRIIGPNDLAGYARWFASSSHYSMVTISKVTASFFMKNEFLALQSKSAYLSDQTNRWLAKVLAIQEDHICILKNSSAKIRVAGTLRVLQKQFGKSIGGKDSNSSLTID